MLMATDVVLASIRSIFAEKLTRQEDRVPIAVAKLPLALGGGEGAGDGAAAGYGIGIYPPRLEYWMQLVAVRCL